MRTLELKKGFYWTGILDHDLKVFDIIMETEYGTTYNSYLLKSNEKTVLFETAKAKFSDEYLEELEKLVKLDEIDYIVLNHTEPDHAGSVEKLIERNPNIKIVGTSVAIGFLKNIVNRDFYSISVKENDTLSLGDKTLKFMILPNLHWPDTMFTYIVEDKILLPCDSFGSHYSFEGIVLSKVTDEEAYQKAFKYYFDNIIGPFKPYMLKALDRIKDLEIELICTGHGPVIDCRIDEIKETYRNWCTVINPNKKKTVIIPYVSAYGYTKELAEVISRGIEDSGEVDVRAYDMVTADAAMVLEELFFADGILFGTPTIVGEALKPIWDLTTSIFAGTHGGKLASAFGSYGWSGEGVPHIIERLKQLRMKVVDGFKVKFRAGSSEQMDAYDYGFNYGCILQNKENPRKADSGSRSLVKCLVCGEIFDSSFEICPVCGVEKENFVPVDAQDTDFLHHTEDTFLILGNGAAGMNAATAIRERNQTSTILMVTNEQFLSYNRPMLTKSMIARFEAGQIAIHDADWYEKMGITNLLGKEIIKLDPLKKEVVLSDGISLSYDKCIYALGSECFIPPMIGSQLPEVVAIRRVSDTEKISEMLPKIKNVVVIGGGVLGLEAAWELKKAKCDVTILEVSERLMERQLDQSAGALLEEIVKEAGVSLRFGIKVDAIEGTDSVTGVRLGTGEVILADLVIISCGVRGNTALAKEAGIQVNRGIVVNEKMETNLPNVYACGDCAEYNGRGFAVWPEAVEMGKTAGANAAGEEVVYQEIPVALTFQGMNTSLFSAGTISKNETTGKSVEFKDLTKKTYEKYYFTNNRLSGVILIGNLKKLAFVTDALEQHMVFQKMF